MQLTPNNLQAALIERVQAHQTDFYHEGSDAPFDRNNFCGGSDIAGCPRKKAFAIAKTPYDEGYVDNRGHMRRGHHYEDYAVREIKACLGEGQALILTGDAQRSITFGVASATRDGVLIGQDGENIGIEIKSVSGEPTLRTSYVLQCNYGAGISIETNNYPCHRYLIVVGNSSDYSNVKVFEHQYDPSLFARQLRLAEDIMSKKDPHELPAVGAYDGSCRFCPYTSACRDAVLSHMPQKKNPDLSEEQRDELYSLVGEIQQRESSLSETKSSLEDMRERLKILLRTIDAKSFSTDWFDVSYGRVSGRETIDRKLLEQAGIELTPYLKKSADSDRLTLKFKKD
jgi:hypothetical protein